MLGYSKSIDEHKIEWLMCGIAGIISADSNYISQNILKKMADTLAHRGPDGEGFWINNTHQVGLAHRRLAIIDLSNAASQPMHYQNRYSIVYNGEIYNYKELTQDLSKQGYHFSTESDTEVLLAAYDCYGDKCVDYLDGMFAFAIWDEVEQLFFAARDRFGEKPFYYVKQGNIFLFASEMKALWAAGVEKRVDTKMLINYIVLGQVQNPSEKAQTFFDTVHALPPAHILTYNFRKQQFHINAYWSIDKQQTIDISEKDAIEHFHNLLQTSVQRRLRSDVPLGICLSGGLDSSTIAYFTRQLKGKNEIKSFSSIFPQFEKDETDYINEVNKSFQLNSYITTPDAYGLVEAFEKIAWHQEEPFSSSSIFAQYKVYELAKKNGVTVLLDGQGADEVLAGYEKYIHWYLQEIISRNRLLKFRSEKAAFAANNIKINWGIKNIAAAYLPSHAALALEKKEYQRILSHPYLSKNLVSHLKGREWEGIHKPVVTKLNDILHFNTMSCGLEELLRYSDRNAMAHSVEVRMPFLQPVMIKFLFSLPSHFKISDGYTKWILRYMMNKKLPDNIVWRTDKIGFEPPQKKWMDEAILKDYIHEARKKLVNEHVLRPSVLNKNIIPLAAHSRNNFDWRYLCAAKLI